MKNNKKLDPAFAETVRWVLEEIRKQQYATSADGDVYFSCIKLNAGPSPDDQRRAIRYLEQQGVLKVKKEKFPMDMMAIMADMIDVEPQGFYLEVIQPQFGHFLGGNNGQPRFEGFDFDRGILHFAGVKIAITVSAKESYGKQLLGTLQKEPDQWWFEDQILGDWGYSDEEQKRLSKNRIYFVARQINQVVERKTQISDFLEYTTEKFRINPTYLKS